MSWSLGEKIEAIRQEPESVRMRYVVLCVSITMIFIFGIWLLSVHESVTTTAQDLPQALEQGKQGMGAAPSLNDLFEQSSPLRIENKDVEGSQFFNQELQGKDKNAEDPTLPVTGQ